MPTNIERNASKVLSFLANVPRDNWAMNQELADGTALSAGDLNDAMSLLVDVGLVEWLQTLGTHPFRFYQAQITPRGRYEVERTESSQEAEETMADSAALKPPTPIGSPYGFHDEDWETVANRKSMSDRVHVVFGYQFKSGHYETNNLRQNIETMINAAVVAYNKRPSTVPIAVEFHSLGAGYGEHQFNEIARDIIGADIAIFETSDLNPNVMIEMGVALTWGVRVLPIKKEGCDKPPSDISGQTWADYRHDASEFVDN
jgi:hypothetical protein